MNKRVLKSYLKGSKREILELNCFRYKDSFLISDSYSIIKLNNNYDLQVQDKDTTGLCKFYEDFENNFETFKEFEPLEVSIMQIDDKYEINMGLLKKINNIIKGNKFTILENKDKIGCSWSLRYVIKIENTKTNEVGYLLPMRKF